MELIDGATTHRGGAEVGGDIGGRGPNSFPGNLQEAQSLWEAIVLINRVKEVHHIHPDQGF